MRAALWPRSSDCAPYAWLVQAVAPHAEAVRDEPEAFVYSAVTDPAALLSVMIQVDER